VIPNPFNTDEYLGKIDRSFGNNHRLSISYYTTAGNNTIRAGTSGQGLPWALQEFDWRQHNANLSDTWIISPTKVNQVWISFTRYFGGRFEHFQSGIGTRPRRFPGCLWIGDKPCRGRRRWRTFP